MKRLLLSIALFCGVFAAAEPMMAQDFVHRPHYIRERQLIPQRTPTYESYYLRKYGRLPPYTREVIIAEPIMPPGYRWSDLYIPGYGYVPQDLILD